MTTRVMIINFGPLPVRVVESGHNVGAKYSETIIMPAAHTSRKYVHSGQRITITEVIEVDGEFQDVK